MREWDAAAYHRVSDPQLQWGLAVLARLPLTGGELVLDVGCGTGRLTEMLCERLPRGRVVGLDLSANMLAVARDHLRPRFGARVAFAQADAARLPCANVADAIFSTATFHWVLDHDALFRSVFAALRPGGRIIAQCGGGPNIRRIHDRCDSLMRSGAFAPFFAAWSEPWQFADAVTTAKRLEHVGFTEIATDLEYTPVVQPDAAAFRDFVASVICRPHLACLPGDHLRADFISALTALSARDDPPFELDYWRLNVNAVKPR